MKMWTFIKKKNFSCLTLLWTFIKIGDKNDAQWHIKLVVLFFRPVQRTGICTSNNKARVESAWFTVAVILQNNPPFLRIQPVVHTQKKKRFAGKKTEHPYASASSTPHPCPSHAILAPSLPPPHLRHLAAAAAPLPSCRRGCNPNTSISLPWLDTPSIIASRGMEERRNRRRHCKGLRWRGRQGLAESRRIRWEVALRRWICKEGGRSSEQDGWRARHGVG